MEEVDELLQHMLSDHPRKRDRVAVKFANYDINYLAPKSGLEPKFIGSMIRSFGQAVVLEALRRFSPGWKPAVFVGICRRVEQQAAGGEPHGNAVGVSTPRPRPSRSTSTEGDDAV